jgi:hypothetical protein
LILLTLAACQAGGDLSDLDWVLGKWQVNDSNNYEEWVKVNDGLLQGKGYKIRDNRTIVNETIEISLSGNEVFYIPTVMNQNAGVPVEFKLVSKSATEIVFENKEHDFPQRIIYVKNGGMQIDARIEGVRDGQFSEVRFQLKKIAQPIL